MLYRTFPQTGKEMFFTEPCSRCKLPYYTVKEMRKRYPDGNFNVIGEIGGIARPTNDGDWLLTVDGKTLPILPRGSLRKPFEWITGYIAVDKNTYIAAVWNLIPAFLRN